MSQQNLVNDSYTQLNPTTVSQILTVRSLTDTREVIVKAGRMGKSISIAGGRYASGGQQFGTNTLLLDTTKLTRMLDFDEECGLIDVEVGMVWSALIQHSNKAQSMKVKLWGLGQKPAGPNQTTIGGALATNSHGPGLKIPPLVAQIDSLTMVDAFGEILTCSRKKNSELFSLVIGGYGLFGLVYAIKLQLVPWYNLERVSQIVTLPDLLGTFSQRLNNGFLYGTCQLCVDETSPNYLQEGILVSYQPVSDPTTIPPHHTTMSPDEWQELFFLTHTNRSKAYQKATAYYMTSSGQIYPFDKHQLGITVKNYQRDLAQQLNSPNPITETLTELYIPHTQFVDFMAQVKANCLEQQVIISQATVSLIEPDEDSFLAWATQPYVCVKLVLQTVHTPPGLQKSSETVRRLIDLAISQQGSFSLAYNRHATRQQLDICYPNFAEFLNRKALYDPDERFQSNWYRHYVGKNNN